MGAHKTHTRAISSPQFFTLLLAVIAALATLTGRGFSLALKASAQPAVEANPVLSDVTQQLPSKPITFPVDCDLVPCLALTFDDGPDSAITPQVLDTLEQEKIPATFFIIGNKVGDHIDILLREQTDGMEIGNHTWAHPDLTKLNDDQIRDQVNATERALRNIGIAPSSLFRPPYGYINQHVVDVVQRPIILWNIDPQDWRAEPETDIEKVKTDAKAGSIIILHDTHPKTAAALPGLVAALKQRGFKFVTVSQLLRLNANDRGMYRGR